MSRANLHSGLAACLGAACGVAVPATALLAWSRLDSARIIPKAPIPVFVEPGLLAAHLALALPLGWGVAARVAGRTSRSARWAWAGAGILLIVATLAAGWAGLPASAGAGFLACGLARSALATALVAPWLVPAAGGAWRLGPRGRLEVLAAVVLAVLPPMTLAYRVVRSRASDFTAHRETGRLALAWEAVETLRGLGVGAIDGSGPIDGTRRVLAGELRRLTRMARATPGPSAPSGERLAHAFALIGLGRVAEAEAEIRPLAATDPDATLLLASIERDQERWADAERDYLRVIAGPQAPSPRDPATLDRWATAYDGLVDVRIGAGRPGEAASALREAIRGLPPRAGHFTLRLGRYELEAGRPRVALGLIDEARRLDPGLACEAAPLIQSIRVRTPACLLAR